MIESCLVLIVVCIVFFGVFQVSQLFAHHEVLQYAAARGARAKTVGFNRFMVFKTIRVGGIPNGGRLQYPAEPGGPALQHAAESPRIPLYMGAEQAGELDAILNYGNWDTENDIRQLGSVPLADGTLKLTVEQQVPLRYAFHRTFYAADNVTMQGHSTIDNHYGLYLDDQDW